MFRPSVSIAIMIISTISIIISCKSISINNKINKELDEELSELRKDYKKIFGEDMPTKGDK